MVIQLRGTNGSGKTWVVNQLFNAYEFKTIVNKYGEAMGYYAKEVNLFILGRYSNSCGGCDNIGSQDEICKRIRKAVRKGWNVVFEGLLSSHLALRYVELYREMQGQGVECFFIFLDTPLEKCYENIMARREASGRNYSKLPRAYIQEDKYVKKSKVNMELQGVPKINLPLISPEQAVVFIVEKLEGWIC